jgi:leucine dehydrogenase
MDVIGERCAYVFCRTEASGGSGDPGPYTARGVFHAIRASAAHVFGSADLAGRTVLVQGLGHVGAALAASLAEARAQLLVSDVVAERAQSVAAGMGATAVDPADVIGAACDVYAPCALGGTLSAETIPSLRCRIVAGSANNQLADPEDAARLRDAGIVYAPDYVVNAGGVLNALGIESLGWSRETVEARLVGIGDALAEIYARAEAEGITTAAAAERLARSRLEG